MGILYLPISKGLSIEWNEFQDVQTEIKNFCVRSKIQGRMPLNRELRNDGENQLANSVLKFGGFRYLANWMGLLYKTHPDKE
jgi:hypothetical protein